MFTSNYDNLSKDDYRKVSISGDEGKKVDYNGECYPSLSPKREFWQIWHDNIDKVNDEDNNKYYIREYYKQVLSKLDPEKVYSDLKDKILLCYEKPYEFCHRAIVAYWIELLFGEEIIEIESKDNSFVSVKRNGQEWIKYYLETIIKQNTPNMRGFNSLMALRLFEKSGKYENQGYKFDEKAKKLYEAAEILKSVDKMESRKLYEKANNYDSCAEYSHFDAAGLRCQADDAEQEYLEQLNFKCLTKSLTKQNK